MFRRILSNNIYLVLYVAEFSDVTFLKVDVDKMRTIMQVKCAEMISFSRPCIEADDLFSLLSSR